MERRELYGPEDIEQLLMQRSYDDLLEEERAFVLKHLAGREEYERMRALLHAVHHNEPEHEMVEAEPIVRERVMDVFRAQRKPQWRIWLNSVRAFIVPPDRTFWKPALAFASLAFLITVGVIGLRSLNDQASEAVAEVHVVKSVPEKEVPFSPRITAPAEPVTDAPVTGSTTTAEPAESPVDAEQVEEYLDRSAVAHDEAAKVDVSSLQKYESEAEAKALLTDVAKAPAPPASGTGAAQDCIRSEGYITSGVVSAADLAANQSITNVSPSSALKEVEVREEQALETRQQARSRKKNEEDDKQASASADLIGLLRTAW